MREITISEYGYIGWDKEHEDDNFVSYRDLEENEFKELKNYWENNADTFKVFTIHNKNCLKATNYVGVIQTDSVSIEILPKTYTNEEAKNTQRKIFIEMLKSLLNVNEVQINQANLSTTDSKNIYEMFIMLFIQSIDKLIHKGIKSDYVLREGNQFFLKGKLKFNQHIKQNYIHKERFYVETDEYLQDRVANRLLKSTIALLMKKTNNFDNKRKLRQQLFIFDEVQLSNNHKIDFTKVKKHRGMEHYNLSLRFAEVFLLHKSFTSLRGKDNVFALLFPMEKVFENYMEFVLNNSKDELGIDAVMVNGGKNEYLLNSGQCKIARLQPDYLLKMKGQKDIVTDAKWKLYETKEDDSKDCVSVNIASNDAYQIFSYLHFYDCQNRAYLFVPETEEFKEKIEFIYLAEQNPKLPFEKKRIKVIPINLEKVINSYHKLDSKLWS